MPNWKSYDSSVRLLSAILAAHPELKLNYQEISRRYGGDCTVSALENRFRRIKSDAKALNDALAQGIDPFTISTDSLNGKAGKDIAKYYGEGTVNSLNHRFRPIRKLALEMRDGIADKYGEDVTAKAVSTRFDRMKKEPAWLTNGNTVANGSSNGNVAGSAKPKTSTPRKKKAVAGAGHGSNSDDDENFDEPKSVTKKNVLNKTQGGRVSKPQTPRKNGSFSANHANAITVDDDEDELIKPEPASNSFAHSFDNDNNHNFGNESMQVDDDDETNARYYEANTYASDDEA